MQLQLIGDEIHFDGQLVALLVQSGTVPSTLREFIDQLNAEKPFHDEEANPECECKHRVDCPYHRAEVGTQSTEYDDAIDDLTNSMKAFARGGLIKISDLQNIGTQLKEEGDINGEADAGKRLR